MISARGKSVRRISYLLQSFEQREFRWLWPGQLVSQLGDQVFRITLVWTVLRITDSPLALGGLLGLYALAFGVSLLPAGLVADRWPRRRLMILSDLGRALLVTAFAALLLAGDLQYDYLLFGALLFGLLDALFQPAAQALVPQVIAKGRLPSANSLFELGRQLTGTLGPALGGGLISFSGAPVAFLFDGLTFLISAMTLYFMGTTAKKLSSGVQVLSGQTSEEGIRPAIQYLRRTPWLWISIVVAAVANGFTQAPLFTLLPFFVAKVLAAGAETLGLLWAGAALGSTLVAAVMGQFNRLRSHLIWGYGGMLLTGLAIGLLWFPLSWNLPVAFLLLLLSGAGQTLFGLLWTHLLQDRIPPKLFGRISSLDLAGSSALVPLGYLGVGVLAVTWSVPLLFLLSGGLTAVLALLALSLPSIRTVD